MTQRRSTTGKTHGPSWSFHHSHGSAIDFHERSMPTLGGGAGEVWIHRADRPAIVLGSAQSPDLIEVAAAEAAGWDVGRRRSGGGVVVIAPGSHLWIDLVIGPDHPLWDDDVHRAFDWVGATWARTLHARTDVDADLHDGPPTDRAAGRLLCFAGLGAGEVSIEGHKVVGASQRRTRAGARFQTMLELVDHADRLRPFARGPLAQLLDERARRDTGQGIGLPPNRPDLDPLRAIEPTLAAFIDQLPRPLVSTT